MTAAEPGPPSGAPSGRRRRRAQREQLLALGIAGGLLLIVCGGLLWWLVADDPGEAEIRPLEDLPEVREALARQPTGTPTPRRSPADPLHEATVEVALDRLGDATVRATATLPPALARRPGRVLIRLLKLHGTWHAISDIRRTTAGGGHVELHYRVRGLARPGPDGTWEVPLGVRPKGLAIDRRRAAFGAGRRRYSVTFPEGSSDLVHAPRPDRLCARIPAAPAARGTTSRVQLDVQHKPRLLACLATSYGYERFARQWVARATLTNTGDQRLTDGRVRFRLEPFAVGWSAWTVRPVLRPGQTLAAGYFPVLDIDKIRTVRGRRQAVLEVEIAYTPASGVAARRVVTRQLELLGRNQVVFSSLPPDERVPGRFADRFDQVPLVLASMINGRDPVIARVAGMIAGQQPGGTAASRDPVAARRFFAGVFAFMQHNRIAYQTPPTLWDKSGAWDQAVQHVMYGRDVLQNRAGTCIDLAVFYASVCEAVGLEPLLLLVPGHILPAVRLPGGAGVVAIESTALRPGTPFEAAVAFARTRYVQPILSARLRDVLIIDVARYRSRGVHPLELPPLPAGVLGDWGGYAAPPR